LKKWNVVIDLKKHFYEEEMLRDQLFQVQQELDNHLKYRDYLRKRMMVGHDRTLLQQELEKHKVMIEETRCEVKKAADILSKHQKDIFALGKSIEDHIKKTIPLNDGQCCFYGCCLDV
jgi:chromosome segregation ATPase